MEDQDHPISDRPQLSEIAVQEAVDGLIEKLVYRLNTKGWGIAVSSAEIMGIVDGEVDELHDAYHEKDLEQMDIELTDIAVACLLGNMSIRSKKIQW